ncbi:NADH-quinone oxidoreductase subunit J [uncultured Psychrobacter sp.]|uniref:NADH-quinone oxidoreductase subunit J n=1 Tax=uncultured Psychrobacter sp. TaxID=259303 RepID=UPI0034586B21
MIDFLNSPDLVGFYTLSAVAIFASLRVITQSNPVHAILSMIVLLLSIAGIMFVLGAPFAGALEVVVYAGAILVLFVFVIMMLNLGMANKAREELWLDAGTWALPTGLMLIVAVVLYALIGLNHDDTAMIGGVTIPAKVVGTVLFSKYIILVEIAALLLLAALVAAYHLGKESLDDDITDEHSRSALRSVNIEKPNTQKSSVTTDRALDTAATAESYEYKEVDPHDYVGMPQAPRKESD